jgi:LuxR family transcriptional regulator, maltose regulon positive regulatory protein
MVQAKAPRIRQPKIIERPRLTRQLDECGARIILLIAPAGYGKTTLARQWLADKPHAWCALSPASRDVAALAAAMAAASRQMVPGAGVRMERRLGLSSKPEAEVSIFAEMLAADLAEWPADGWLALDDYQALTSGGCEGFVEAVVSLSPLRLLVMSRSAPGWTSPRSRMYGLHYELTRDDLAMTDAEARQVVPNLETVDIAKGWPAVLGLAASLESVAQQQELSDSAALHTFLAEELLRHAPARVQRTLLRLSLCPDMPLQKARSVLGAGRVASLVDRSERLGLVTVRDGWMSMHPLIRQFVQGRHRERDPEWEVEVHRVARSLITNGLWDEAFTLIDELNDEELLEELVGAALEPMLRSGRHATIARWLGNRTSVSPWLLLAEAELASRRGDQRRAEALALQSARRAGSARPAALALNLAGRSAHLRDRYQAAIECHRQAEVLSTTARETFDSLWGQLIVGWQMGNDADDLVDRLHSYADASVDSQLRLTTALQYESLRQGTIAELFDRVQECLVLAPRAASPLTSTSFLVGTSRLFAVVGRYDEALRIADQTVGVAEEHRLAFVLPSVLNVRAMALIGLREWGPALRALTAAEAHAHDFDDIHNEVDAHIQHIRLLLAKGQPAQALQLTERSWLREAGWLEQAEYAATVDLVWAAAGLGDQQAECPAPHAELLTLRLAAAAIRSLKRRRGTKEAMRALLDHVMTTSCVDGFIIGYRACPDLLARSLRDSAFRSFIAPALVRARDQRIASRLGLRVPRATKPQLTKREREVHELLAQGLTNREIARLLYVEEVTVKVHVRHILDKLGVRTRVEAATKVVD